MPRTITYAYPGLWASAGLNEHGLGLVWTGSGYRPKVKPVVGVPTYALIAGILACRDCREAFTLLDRTPRAGSFIFFIADAKNEVWVIEGLPDRIEKVRCTGVVSRANHYECGRMCAAAKQVLPPARPGANSRARGERMAELTAKYNGRIDAQAVEKMLTDHGRGPGLNICVHPQGARRGMTLDSFYVLPARREFHISRGLPCRHAYAKYKV